MPSRETSASLASYWKQQIDAWQASNQSQKAFCRANDLNYHRFGYWRRKFLEPAAEAQCQRETDFVPVTYASQAEASGLSLVLPNGLVLQGIATDNLTVVYQLYAFTNRRRNKIKCLYWEDNGFVLYYKSLAEEKFRWPRVGDQVMPLTGQQINWLLDGYDISQMKGHKKLHYEALF